MALVIESKQGISFTDIQAATKVGLYLAGAVEVMGKRRQSVKRRGRRINIWPITPLKTQTNRRH